MAIGGADAHRTPPGQLNGASRRHRADYGRQQRCGVRQLLLRPCCTAELWDPAQDSFTELASATRYRGYHSIALLLPDGRVLSSGGDNEPNAEVFSPPYLFKGARPVVTSTPSSITYGESFSVDTPDATSITAVTLVRLSAVTHAFNMNQRFLRLAFSQTPGGLTVTAPSGAKIAPPGHYMLFVLNAAGVPSIAPIVRLPPRGARRTGGADEFECDGCVEQPDQPHMDRQRLQRIGVPHRAIGGWHDVHEIGAVGLERHDLRQQRLVERCDSVLVSRSRLQRDGASAFAGPASATTARRPPHRRRRPDLSATAASSSQINLTWTDNASNESGFPHRAIDGWHDVHRDRRRRPRTSRPMPTAASLSAATQYWYRVHAYNGYGAVGLCWPGERDHRRRRPPHRRRRRFECDGRVEQLRSTSHGRTTPPTNRVSASSDRRMARRSLRSASSTSNVTTYADSASLSAATQYWYRVSRLQRVGAVAFAGPASATTAVGAHRTGGADGFECDGCVEQPDQPHMDGQRLQRIGFPHRAIGGWHDVHSDRRRRLERHDLCRQRLVEPCARSTGIALRLQRDGAASAFAGPASATTAVGAHRTGGTDGFECDGRVEQLRSTSRGRTTPPTNRGSASSDRRMALRSLRSASSTSNVTTYADSASLSAATQYWYRVYAYNGVGASAFAGPASATTSRCPPHRRRRRFECDGRVEQLRSTSRGPTTPPTNRGSASSDRRMARRSLEIGVVSSNVTTYADSASLSAGDAVLVSRSRLQRDGAVGLCRPSERDDPAATTATPPSAPTGLIATRQPGRITLTWTDTSNNETGFSIERSPDGHAFSQIATVAANVSTYVDTSPGASKYVFYRVRAFNAGWLLGLFEYVEGAEQVMRRKEGVMRYVNIAMAAIAALHLSGDRCERPERRLRPIRLPISGRSAVDEPVRWGSTTAGRSLGSPQRSTVSRGLSCTTGGSLVDLGTLGGDESFAYRISDNGIIVGRAQDSSGRFHAFMTTINGKAIELNSLDPRADGDFGTALGVNSVGEVTGYYTTAGDHMSARNRVFFYRDSRVEDLGTFGGEDGSVVAVNDRGSLVGFFSSEPHADYAQHRVVSVYRRQARADRVARRAVDDSPRSEQPGRSRR